MEYHLSSSDILLNTLRHHQHIRGRLHAAAARTAHHTRTITVEDYVRDNWQRRSDVDSIFMISKIKIGSRVWQVSNVLPGYPLDEQAIYPCIVWFYFTDDYGKRRYSRWPVKPDDTLTVVFRDREARS